jgi:predicted TIM-barrel fold metal-dependent hydrolase
LTNFIIDAHNHYDSGSTHLAWLGTGSSNADEPAGKARIERDIESRMRLLDGRGVSQAVILASHGYLRPDGIADTRRINDELAEYRDTRPDRFPAVVGVVEPLFGERGLAELDRCKNELGLGGISFHTRFQGVSVDSPLVRRYIERMAELSLVPFVHAMGESSSEALWKLDLLAQDFRDVPMVVLDAFSTIEQASFVPHVAERHPQLVFDTALAHGLAFGIRAVIHRCGPAQIVYGSDIYSPGPTNPELPDVLPEILSLGISDDARAAILAGNISRVLGLKMA